MTEYANDMTRLWPRRNDKSFDFLSELPTNDNVTLEQMAAMATFEGIEISVTKLHQVLASWGLFCLECPRPRGAVLKNKGYFEIGYARTMSGKK